MSKQQKQILFENTARALDDALDFIKYRHIRNCYFCDPDYGEGIAKALGMTVKLAMDSRKNDPALWQKGLL